MNTSIISVRELQRLLEEDRQVLVLDIRPKDQRDEWRIAGSHHIDAYRALNEGDKTILNEIELPPGVPVVTVCAAGKTSQIAASILMEKGFNAYSLDGGMKAWNYAWNTAEIMDKDLVIVQVRRVAKGCISYIFGSRGEAVVVDASLDPRVYLDIAAKHNWKIKYVMDTHIHADYISRTIDLAGATGAQHLFTENAEVKYAFLPLKDQDVIKVGSAQLTAIYTPGHTPESVSYLINDSYLLTGDTLFTDGIGRPDLKADREQGLQKSVQLFDSLNKIFHLRDEDLLILPAHTSQAIAFDKKLIAGKLSMLINELELLQLNKDDFIEQIVKRIPPPPPNYLQIAAINKSGSYEGLDPADLEAGANRCAVS